MNSELMYTGLFSPADDEGERGENKTWANISLYTVVRFDSPYL